MDYISGIINTISLSIQKELQDKIMEYLKCNLSELGFAFKTELECAFFFKERVTRVDYDLCDTVEYYLDFKNENERGTLIGITNEKRQSITFGNDGSVVVSVGK